MLEEERAGRRIVKFTTIITLDTLDGGVKLCACIGKEIGEDRERLGLEMKWESPNIMRTIIEDNKIVLVTGDTDHGRCSEVTMY